MSAGGGANLSHFVYRFQTVYDTGINPGILSRLEFPFITFTLQSVPRVMAQTSKDAKGGNVIGLDTAHGEKIWVESSLG